MRVVGLCVAGLFALLLVLFLVAPLLVSASVSVTGEEFLAFPPVGFSWRWYRAIWTTRAWREALLNTALIGLACMVLATLVGAPAAYGISRLPGRRQREAAVLLFIAPLAVPHMTLALALYPAFAATGLIGTRASLAIGHAIFALPFVVLSVLSVIRPRDRVLEAAARTLGASPLTAFRRVTLPLLLPGVVAGAVLSFMVSFDDVTLPIFLSGSSAGTLPKAMLDALVLDSDPTVMSASTLVALVGLALFALGSLASRWLSSGR